MKTFLHRPFEDCTNVGQKVRFHGLSLFAIAMVAFIILPGCAMFVPYSGMWGYKDKNVSVPFLGGAPNPGQKITLQAHDPNILDLDVGWHDIPGGEAVYSATDFWSPTIGGGYHWSISLNIPQEYWGKQCSSTGEGALVRALYWFENPPNPPHAEAWRTFRVDGWDVCKQEHQDPADWYLNCTDSPIVKVSGSPDFRDFGWECVRLINQIRALENEYWKSNPPPLPIGEILPLMRYAEGECDADKDARCNYKWERDNCGSTRQCPPCCPHHCQHGAQNECNFNGLASRIDDILMNRGACIWDGWYFNHEVIHGEKQHWMNNPPTKLCPTWEPDGCYMAGMDKDECGHYVTMVVCPKYKKVSCGLYEITGEAGQRWYKAVANFFE